MTTKRFLFLFLIAIYSLLFSLKAYSQQKEIDSLKKELIKFDAHKKELGTKLTPLMDSTRANIMYRIIQLYNVYMPDSAMEYFRQLKSLSERIGYKKGIARAYYRLARMLIPGKEQGDFELVNYQKALKIQLEIGDKEGAALTYNWLGNMYHQRGNYVDEAKNHTMAARVYDEIGDKSTECQSYRKLSGAYAYLGDYQEALKCCFNALKCAEESGDKDAIEGAYKSIAGTYDQEGNRSEALKNYIAASKVRDKYDNPYEFANSYSNFGNIYIMQGDTIDALMKYNQALKIFEDTHDGYGIVSINSIIGGIKYNQQDFAEALKHYLVSLQISKDIVDNYNITNLSNQVAEGYVKLGNYPQALSYVNSGLALALKTNFKSAIRDSYRILADIYAKQNDFKTAYYYKVLFEQIKDTLQNTETASKLKEMGMKYDYDKETAMQKAEQEKKDAVRESELQAQRFKRNSIYIGLAALVLFLVVMIIQRNKIARQRRQKALETERSRISRDLHDDLGSGLTSILKMSEQMKTATNKDLIDKNINKIEENSKLMVDQMRIIIWALNSKNDTLENLLIYMEIYFMDYFENLPVKLKFHLPKHIPEMMMTGMARRNVFLVVKESLNNINKHAQATEVNITITANNESVNVVIADNGVGFLEEEKKKFSYGLNNMKTRMTDINGTFKIDSVIGHGTNILINFPFIEN